MLVFMCNAWVLLNAHFSMLPTWMRGYQGREGMGLEFGHGFRIREISGQSMFLALSCRSSKFNGYTLREHIVVKF